MGHVSAKRHYTRAPGQFSILRRNFPRPVFPFNPIASATHQLLAGRGRSREKGRCLARDLSEIMSGVPSRHTRTRFAWKQNRDKVLRRYTWRRAGEGEEARGWEEGGGREEERAVHAQSEE